MKRALVYALLLLAISAPFPLTGVLVTLLMDFVATEFESALLVSAFEVANISDFAFCSSR